MHNLGESYLRGVIITAAKEASQSGDLMSSIKNHANNRLGLIQEAQNLIGGKNIEQAAFGMAIQGIELAFSVLSLNLQTTKFMRQQFCDECENDIASFILDGSLEESCLSQEEKAIKQFYKLLQTECAGFINYFGIQDNIDPVEAKRHRLTILPFFRMSQALEQKQLLASKLEQYRQAIYLFLKTDLGLKDYYQNYKKTYSQQLNLQGMLYAHNFLNWYRAPRFIILAIANLLWNLQHPVDPDTGLPLNLTDSENMCKQAKAFFDILMDKNVSQDIFIIDQKKPLIYPYLLKVETYIQGLQDSFLFERLHELNVLDVSHSMHRALRILADKTLELIYKDKMASQTIVGLFSELGILIQKNPGFFDFFKSANSGFHFFSSLAETHYKFLNKPAASLIDLLILLSHLDATSRVHLFQQAIHQSHEPYQQIGRNLKKIHRLALLPYEALAKDHLHKLKDKTPNTQAFIAQRFIALFVLVMECFSVFDDTRHKSFLEVPQHLKDKEQRQAILQDADAQDVDTYYQWSLSIFLKNQSKTSHHLDELLKTQYLMLRRTKFLDKLGHLVLNNRMLLQQKAFQNMLIQVLKTICKTYQDLNEHLNEVELEMQNDACIERHEKRVLQPMLDDLESAMEAIQQSILQVSKIIQAPNFTQQEKLMLEEQTQDIEQEFQDMFHASIKLDNSMRMNLAKNYKSSCLSLVQDCISALSYLSYYGQKGQGLFALKQELIAKPNVDENSTKTFLAALINICAKPRSSYFFQADYGQTRSCQSLIKHIQRDVNAWPKSIFNEHSTDLKADSLLKQIHLSAATVNYE